MKKSKPYQNFFSEERRSYVLGPGLSGLGVLLMTLLASPHNTPSQYLAIAAATLCAVFFPTLIILRLWKVIEAAEESATTDQLTGLYRLHGATRALQVELFTMFREDKTMNNAPVSLVMIDMDHFKEFNDRRGHPAGNKAIQQLSSLLHEVFHRQTDICCRYGGDEFLVLLPKTTAAVAQVMTEQLRKKVEEVFQKEGITISSGINSNTITQAEAVRDHAFGGFFEKVIKLADEALYTSKRFGKNRITVYTETSQTSGEVTIAL